MSDNNNNFFSSWLDMLFYPAPDRIVMRFTGSQCKDIKITFIVFLNMLVYLFCTGCYFAMRHLSTTPLSNDSADMSVSLVVSSEESYPLPSTRVGEVAPPMIWFEIKV